MSHKEEKKEEAKAEAAKQKPTTTEKKEAQAAAAKDDSKAEAKKEEQKPEEKSGRLRSMGRGRTRTAPPSQAPGAAPAAAVAPAAPPATPPETPGDGSRGKTPGRGIGKPMEGEEEQDPDREKGSPSSAGTGDGKDVSPERVTRDKLKDLQVATFAQRPGFGTMGKPINLETNHFLLSYPEKLVVYQYTVEMTSQFQQRLNRDDKRMAFWALIQAYPTVFNDRHGIAFDGVKTFFSFRKLPLANGRPTGRYDVMVRLKRDNFPGRISANVSFLAEIPVDMDTIRLSNLQSDQYVTPLQFLDIVCRQARALQDTAMPDADKWFIFNASTYMIPHRDRPPNPLDLGGGLHMWHGLFTGAHVAQGYRPMLNLDVANGVFYHNANFRVLDFLVEVLNDALKPAGRRYHTEQLSASTKLNEAELKAFRKAISGVKVRVNHRDVQREYTVQRLAGSAAETTFFIQQDQAEITVAAYFARRYGDLQYPSLPLLQTGKQKVSYLPLEHCSIVHPQRCVKKLSEGQTSTMIKSTAVPAPERRDRIYAMLRQARFDIDGWVRKYGIKVANEMAKVAGRILEPPRVEFNSVGCRAPGGPVVKPFKGEWPIEQQTMLQPGTPLVSYGLMVPYGTSTDSIKPVFQSFHHVGQSMQLRIAPVWMAASVYKNDGSDFEAKFTALLNEIAPNENGLRMIFVITDAKSSALYADVKRVAEIVTGTITQCMQKKNAKVYTEGPAKAQRAATISRNILLKVNAKMGGVNWRLFPEGLWKSLTEPENCTLFIGADVSHPSPFDKVTPSVAAIVSNTDLAATRYSSSIKVQKKSRDPIMSLYDQIRERLLAFYASTNKKPARLIFYRDGVADSQFREVFATELRDIREACKSLEVDYSPKVTFIISMKRHHTRFFCINRNDGVGRSLNVPPGTVVDREITSPQIFDFYLCSHFGIQGTSRPTRYVVLYDENEFKPDAVQAMTYALSNLYCRCSRSVSIPAPVYYAHWAGLRAKHHLMNKVANFASDTMSSASDEASVPVQELQDGVRVEDRLRQEMYFV